MVQGVIFDMDGLMFDTEPVWGASWEPVLQRFGLTLDPQMVVDIRGTAGETMNAVIRRFCGDDAPADEIRLAAIELVEETVLKGVPTKPGLHELLEYLHDCMIPLAVASASKPVLIDANLASAKISGYFDVTLSGESLGRGKPDPLIFLETAKLLGTDPARTVVLEDSYNGVRAGRAGGFITVMVPDLAAPTDEMYELADAVVERLDDVIDLMEAGKLG